MLALNNLSPNKGSNKKSKRIGRGQASGRGTQAGKGHKGQKARKSGGVRPGFEGGNLPLYMRLPKMHKFTNAAFKKDRSLVRLGDIARKFDESETVNIEKLYKLGLISSLKKDEIKVVLKGDFEKKLNFEGPIKFSAGAKNKILEYKGTIS